MSDSGLGDQKIDKERAAEIASREPTVKTFMGDRENLRQVVLEGPDFFSVIYRGRDEKQQMGFQFEVRVCKKTGRVVSTHAHPVRLG